jgi:CRP-like cAMP-binding protein
MSVFDAEPRSASVTTLEPCDCLVLTQQQLYDAIDETPGIAVNIIRLLSRRIRELNQDLNLVKSRLKAAKSERDTPHPTAPAQRPAATPYAGPAYPVPSWDGPIPYGNVPY